MVAQLNSWHFNEATNLTPVGWSLDQSRGRRWHLLRLARRKNLREGRCTGHKFASLGPSLGLKRLNLILGRLNHAPEKADFGVKMKKNDLLIRKNTNLGIESHFCHKNHLNSNLICNFIMTVSISFQPPYTREETKHLDVVRVSKHHKSTLYKLPLW